MINGLLSKISHAKYFFYCARLIIQQFCGTRSESYGEAIGKDGVNAAIVCGSAKGQCLSRDLCRLGLSFLLM